MIDKLYQIFRLLRPRQWLKNLALFAAITFSGQLFTLDSLTHVSLGFIAFCLLSSSTYIINDILDLSQDRLHPFKRARPLASRKVTMAEALTVLIIFIVSSLALTISLGPPIFSVAIFYIILQISYSTLFKSIAVFDILFIAVGYIVRVFTGELLTGYHISAWLLLTTISLSLFLAVGKRRSELTLLSRVNTARLDEVRKSLSHYSERLLDVFSTMFATSTFIFYTMFTFLENPSGIRISVNLFLPDFLPFYLQRKWLMVTILPVVYGIMRYLQDIYEKNEGESPERVLLSDKPLLAALIVWFFLLLFIIYVIG